MSAEGLVKERDFSLDFMRFLGILIIMIAHSDPPPWLYQLRNFGTPLLVVASGLTYAFIYRHRHIEVKSFYKKRLSRLVFPAWIFLTIFFLFYFITFRAFHKPSPFEFKIIIDSYYFSGILYIWILKVYIVLTLVTPAALKLESRIQNTTYYMMFLLLLYIAYELLFSYISPLIPQRYRPVLFSNIFLVVPYSILFLYGLKLEQLGRVTIFLISLVALAIFLVLAVLKFSAAGEFVQTQGYRYPPTLYYLSYAFFCLNMVYLYKDYIVHTLNKELITWLSSNSLWIYLWHILAAYSWNYCLGSTNGELFISILKAASLLLFGISVTYMQVKVVKLMFVHSENAYICWLSRMLSPA